MILPVRVEDVKREVKILRALSGHENMVQFHNAFEDDYYVYIAMESKPVPLGPIPAVHSLIMALISLAIFTGMLFSTAAEIRDTRCYWRRNKNKKVVVMSSSEYSGDDVPIMEMNTIGCTKNKDV
ncbi:calcium-dependent protein kinase 28-like protein [Tanacetum coccineum]